MHRFAALLQKLPRKQLAISPAVAGAHRVNSGGEGQRVALIKQQKSHMQRFRRRLPDVICVFH